MFEYSLEVVNAFTDKNTNQSYKPGDIIKVTEERALELFSSNYHVVKFLNRVPINIDERTNNSDDSKDVESNFQSSEKPDNLDDSKNIENTSQKETDNSNTDNKTNDNLNSLNYKQLLKIANEKNLDITGANNKEKLKTLIRNSQI